MSADQKGKDFSDCCFYYPCHTKYKACLAWDIAKVAQCCLLVPLLREPFCRASIRKSVLIVPDSNVEYPTANLNPIHVIAAINFKKATLLDCVSWIYKYEVAGCLAAALVGIET